MRESLCLGQGEFGPPTLFDIESDAEGILPRPGRFGKLEGHDGVKGRREPPGPPKTLLSAISRDHPPPPHLLRSSSGVARALLNARKSLFSRYDA